MNTAILEILKYPDPFLKTKASEVKTVDGSIKTLIAGMIETMYHAKGIGLAAVQVGVDKRVIVLDVPDENVEERQKANPVARQP
jgi:peptide deformylase